MCGAEAMKLAVFWCESDKCALIRRSRLEIRTGIEIVVEYGIGCVSRITNR